MKHLLLCLIIAFSAFGFVEKRPDVWIYQDGENGLYDLDRTNNNNPIYDNIRKEELLEMLKTGEIRVSKAVIFEDKKPVCFIDTVNKRRLVPDWTQPASHSSITIKRDFPMCDSRQESQLLLLTSGMVPEGTQMAGIPLALSTALTGSLVGCGFGFMIPFGPYLRPSGISQPDEIAVPGFVGGVVYTLLNMLVNPSFVGDIRGPKVWIPKTFMNMGIGGITGLIGAMACGSVVFYLEWDRLLIPDGAVAH